MATEKVWVKNPTAKPLIIESIVFPILATLILAFRISLRIYDRRVGLDDLFIVSAMLCNWVLVGCTFYGWYHGLGAHTLQVPPMQLIAYLKALWFYVFFYGLSTFFWKMSLVYFYKRIFTIIPLARKFLLGIELSLVAWVLTRIFADLFQCLPVSHYWTRINPKSHGHCINSTNLYLAMQCINIFTDILLYIFPIPIIWKLQLSTARRASVIFLFLCGALVIAVATVRAVKIPEIMSADFAYADATTGIYTILEVCFGVITPCLPSIHSLAVNWRNRGSSARSSCENRQGADIEQVGRSEASGPTSHVAAPSLLQRAGSRSKGEEHSSTSSECVTKVESAKDTSEKVTPVPSLQ